MASSPLIPNTPSADAYAAEADQGDVFTTSDPFALFSEWFALAAEHEPNDPNAMALATAGSDGAPDVRVVLLKDVCADGFTFYTNTLSAKGRELTENPKAALNFHWKSIRRQVRVRGDVAPVKTEEADAYFAERARGSRIGAWASDQSRPLKDRADLHAAVSATEERFENSDVPRPEHWHGYRVTPTSIEFWVNKPFRLHDRLLFSRDGGGWSSTRLFP
ncbi:MAG: pyridoxamine 5'-phosphate oxidase [Pseudomonadota bacterium]